MRMLEDHAQLGDAQRVCDALRSHEVDSEVKEGGGGRFGVWVHDENDMERARALSQSWAQTATGEVDQAARRGRALRVQELQQEDLRRRESARQQHAWEAASSPPTTPVTWTLIGIAVLVTVAMSFGNYGGFADTWLYFQSVAREGVMLRYDPSLPWSEPWRFVTPIFIHASLSGGGIGFLHILFNVLWMKDLGRTIEVAHSGRYLLVFVVVCGALSNTMQFLIQGPLFGGLSGVVYGLLALIWVRGRLDPRARYAVPQSIVIFMLIWLVYGFVAGRGGGMANYCHLGGLLVGAAWGWLASQRANAS